MENVGEPPASPRETSENHAFEIINRLSGVSDFSPHELAEMIHVPVEESSPRGACDESSDCDTASTSDLERQQHSGSRSNWRCFLHLLKKGPKRFQTFHPLSIPKLYRKKSRSSRHSVIPALPAFDNGMHCFKSSWKNFSLSDLQEITNNFSQENLIGEGGYAEVYKGILQDGKLVAVKRLAKGNFEDMVADFLSELGIIVHVNHPNIAEVIGYGVDKGMYIVLHLSPHGSLDSLLRGSKEKLRWDVRFKIALGSAEGLKYLHEGCRRRIIHRDIKSANILLTEDFEPQISDFGLAKWLPEHWTHHTVSKIEGTFGYLPPEFFTHGIADEKTDVYAYGVLLLELITGRLALDDSRKSLLIWAKPLLETHDFKELVDPSLGDAYDMNQLKMMCMLAFICIHHCAVQRPQMSQVVQILTDVKDHFELRKPTLKRAYSVELYDAEECNSTKYLSDWINSCK